MPLLISSIDIDNFEWNLSSNAYELLVLDCSLLHSCRNAFTHQKMFLTPQISTTILF